MGHRPRQGSREALLDDDDLDAAWTAVTTGAAKPTASRDQRLRSSRRTAINLTDP
jgi:hypothetical protein